MWNRAVQCALVVIGVQLMWPLSLVPAGGVRSTPQDAMAGARVFARKGCAQCHAPIRAGPSRGPDLRRRIPPLSLIDLTAALWNHRVRLPEGRGAEPRLDERETADLTAFLFALGYLGTAGDARAGGELFLDKKCVTCHQVAGRGGVVGPRLDDFKECTSPILMAASLWNHGPQMAEARQQQTGAAARPRLTTTELRNLIAYLESVSSVTLLGPFHLLPGSPGRGHRAFVGKGCAGCHGGDEVGLRLAGRRVRSDLIAFAAVMWNKAPAMTRALERRPTVVFELSGDDMADLIAYLRSIGYFADLGDAGRGRKLAMEKGCVRCHASYGGTAKARNDVGQPLDLGSPSQMIMLAWNHSLALGAAPEGAEPTWRPLTVEELVDLTAFYRSSGAGNLRPGSTSRGR